MLAILSTHPIQYQVPLWRMLAKDARVPFEVWYLTSHAIQPSHDPEFGTRFAWDLDMLAGYPHRFLEVAAGARPGSFLKCRLRERLRDRLQTAGVRALWIQGWQVAAYWQAVWEAKAAGVEVWLRGESNVLAPVPWWKAPAKKLLLSQFFRRVDRFLYIGSANRRLYEKYGVPPDRLYPAPYAVDNERFVSQARELEDRRWKIREEWGIPKDAFCVLFCGKFIPKKRPFDLIEAARILITNNSVTDNRIRNVHLLFVGSGELGCEMRARCNVVFDADSSPNSDLRTSSSGKPRASFAGFLNQTEISKAYVAADVLVLPSDYRETWGLVVNEAMASGLPCIMSDQCGCAGDLGRTVPNATYECANCEELACRLCEIKPNYARVSFEASLSRYSLGATVHSIAHIGQ